MLAPPWRKRSASHAAQRPRRRAACCLYSSTFTFSPMSGFEFETAAAAILM